MRRSQLRRFAPFTRPAALIAALTAAAALLLVAVIPQLLANDSVRSRIRSELSVMTGLPVAVNGDISISVLPRFTARLTNVEAGSPETQTRQRIIAKTVEVDMSWLAALGRDVQIQAVRIDGADIYLSPDSTGNWLPPALASPLAPALLQARAALDENPSQPDFSFVEDWKIGSLTLTNSTLRASNENGVENVISNITAGVSWPGLALPLQSNGGGTWRGKPLRYSALIRNPLRMAARGSSDVMAKVESETIRFEFNGVANLETFLFANGAMSFETPSMGALLDWLGAKVDPGNAVGPMSLNAKLTTKDDHLNFDDAVINFNDNPAKGVFVLSRQGGLPALSGTLAFEKLDLASFLSAFSIGLNPDAGTSLRFLDQMSLDLRLSAQSANAGAVPLTEVAAAVRIKNGKADFDLGDAALYGGRAQGTLSISGSAGGLDGDLRARLTDVDLSLIPNANAMATLKAPMQASLVMKGKYAGFIPFVKDGEGEADITVAAGEMRNLDAAQLRQRLDLGLLFNLPDIYRSAAGLKSAKAKARLDKGVVILTESAIDFAGGKIGLTGALPIFSRGIALQGWMVDTNAGELPNPRRFFVGGSWEMPFITPIK